MPKNTIEVWKVRGEHFLRDLVRVAAGGDPNILKPYINQIFEDHGKPVTDNFYDVLKHKEDYKLFLSTQKQFIEFLPLWKDPAKNNVIEMAMNYYDNDPEKPKHLQWTGTGEGLAKVLKEFRAKNKFRLSVTDSMIKKIMLQSFKTEYSLTKIKAATPSHSKNI